LSKGADSNSLKSIGKTRALDKRVMSPNKGYFKKAQMRNGLRYRITNRCQIDHLFSCYRWVDLLMAWSLRIKKAIGFDKQASY
jgi:hypothetical protein